MTRQEKIGFVILTGTYTTSVLSFWRKQTIQPHDKVVYITPTKFSQKKGKLNYQLLRIYSFCKINKNIFIKYAISFPLFFSACFFRYANKHSQRNLINGIRKIVIFYKDRKTIFEESLHFKKTQQPTSSTVPEKSSKKQR